MVYIRSVNTNIGVRFWLQRADRTKVLGTGYYQTMQEAWRVAKKLGLTILNYKRSYKAKMA